MTMRKRPLVNILSISTLLMVMTPAPTLAKEFLCDATQASTTQLPQLDKSCPIGKGLWGKQKPKHQDSQFWIQCGIYNKPLALDKAKKLYQRISTDVWMKPEDKGYRCLIGPYTTFAQAKNELVQVKKQPGYKEAFIREVSGKIEHSKPARPAKEKRPPAKKVTTTKMVTQPARKTTSTPANVKTDISIRLQTSLNNTEYKVPYILFSDDLFYMEHELPWNRMSYDGAYKTCRQLGMRLANPQEWKVLLDSKVMEKDNWPIHLPYWGAEHTGLFYNGKVNQLKGSSRLNVMCVK